MIVNFDARNITFFTSSLGNGGAQRTIVNLATGFSELGYSVDLVLINAEGPYLRDLPPDVDIVEVEGNRALTSVPYLVRYLHNEQPDVLFSTMEYLNVVTLLSEQIATVSPKTVIRTANIRTESNSRGWKTNFQAALARRLYPRADTLVALSTDVRDEMANHYDLKDEDISIIHNPVQVSNICHLSEADIDSDALNKDAELLVSVGRLSEQKDMATTIRAFARLRERRDVELAILGDGDRKADLLRLTDNLGIRDRVHFLGFVDNPFAYMRAADVFTLSSKWEGFGHVIVEAMTCGTPVVSTDCPGGPSEILDDGRYGSLVPVGDEAALADAIEQTLADPPAEERLLERATDFEYLDISKQYEQLLFGDDSNE